MMCMKFLECSTCHAAPELDYKYEKAGLKCRCGPFNGWFKDPILLIEVWNKAQYRLIEKT